MRHQQADKGTAQRQRQSRQDGDRVQKAFEQQHQHDVDAQHTDHHGQTKAGKEFAHDFSITHLHHPHAGRQALQAGQFLHRFGHVAQRHVGQLDFKVDVALPVVTVNDRRTAGEGHLGHLPQHDRASGAGHHQAFKYREVFAGIGLQAHNNGNLPL